jgi:hypothetical protein
MVSNIAGTSVELLQGEQIAWCEPVGLIDATVSNPEDTLTEDLVGEVQENNSPQAEEELDQEVPDHLKVLLADLALVPEQRKQVAELILNHQTAFIGADGEIGRTDLIKHEIHTGDAPPKRIPARRQPAAMQELILGEVNKMLKRDVIVPSNSPWSSPIVLVKKKDGMARFCVDYCLLNDVTTKDAYPLPNIEDTFDALSGASYFCALDLASGYWQVEMDEDSQRKTAFSTRYGLYEFRVMPFGLCNAPATFERLMETVLRGNVWQRCLVYLDDIIVYGKDFPSTLANLDTILTALEKANLRLKPSKCEFFKKALKFLGFIITGQGVSCDPDKIKAVEDWPTPTNLRKLRSFLGFCNYLRRFVPNYSVITVPLVALTHSAIKWEWGSEQEGAFRELKTVLTQAPMLAHPLPGAQFILDTDASAMGIGGVLSQNHPDGTERVIAYASQTLSKTERNYCTTKRELLAVVRMLKKFRHYLWGREFRLRTDHASLTWLLNFKDPDGMLQRWLTRMSEYHIAIEHRPGIKHCNADGMSRCMGSDVEPSPERDSTDDMFDGAVAPRTARQTANGIKQCLQSLTEEFKVECHIRNVRYVRSVPDGEDTIVEIDFVARLADSDDSGDSGFEDAESDKSSHVLDEPVTRKEDLLVKNRIYLELSKLTWLTTYSNADIAAAQEDDP